MTFERALSGFAFIFSSILHDSMNLEPPVLSCFLNQARLRPRLTKFVNYIIKLLFKDFVIQKVQYTPYHGICDKGIERIDSEICHNPISVQHNFCNRPEECKQKNISDRISQRKFLR